MFRLPDGAFRRALALAALTALYGAAGAGDAQTVTSVGEEEYYIRTTAKIGNTHMPSVRSRGMGGAYTALSNGAASVNENPAALGAMQGRGVEAMVGYDKVDNGDDDSTEMALRVGAAFNLSPYVAAAGNQTVAVAVSRRDLDASLATGEFTQDVFSLAYGSNFGADILWGVTLSAFDGDHKYAYNLLDGVAGDKDKLEFSGGELAGGVLYRMGDDFTLGGTAYYGGGTARSHRSRTATTGVRDRKSGDLTLWGARAGAAWQIADATLLAADLGYRSTKIDIKTRNQKTTEFEIAFGVEHALIPESIVARAGVNYHRIKLDGDAKDPEIQRVLKSTSEDYIGFTAGLGARIRAADLNYTLDVRTTGDIGNYFNAQFGF